MASSLQEIRAKLASMESNSKPNSSSGGDNAIYPHWNIDENSSTTLRFLPDSDPNNTFFWVERQMIRLTFPGVKGGDMKPVTVQVPCAEMYGDTCPVLTEVRPWFKDASLEDLGRKYWKKRSYIFQGFVTENPLSETAPENPVRRFVISPQIFNIIKSALMDPDMENIPTDYVAGTDFRVTKTTKGQYADYSTSKWARKERGLDETELAAIDANGLFTLSDFLPKRPGQDELNAISEMFQASVDGELYDPERWAMFYKPYGVETPKSATQPTTASVQTAAPVAAVTTADIPFDVTPTAAPVVETAPAPVAPVVPLAPAAESDAKPSATDILNMIKNRS
tara:strand:+ start:1607 stop:2620 length:1014 start_codon:yes stop_codon:yes gene_type:complete